MKADKKKLKKSRIRMCAINPIHTGPIFELDIPALA